MYEPRVYVLHIVRMLRRGSLRLAGRNRNRVLRVEADGLRPNEY